MTKHNCESIGHLLTAHADGELPDAEWALVGEHVKGCAACRQELFLLRRSLEHARAIWQASTADAKAVRFPTRVRVTRLRRVALASTAACAVAAVIVGAWLLGGRQLNDLQDNSQAEIADREPGMPAADSALDLAEVESLIAREVQSARLAASAELLASEPSLADYRRRADQYLAAAYENSVAGQQAKRRLGQSPGS